MADKACPSHWFMSISWSFVSDTYYGSTSSYSGARFRGPGILWRSDFVNKTKQASKDGLANAVCYLIVDAIEDCEMVLHLQNRIGKLAVQQL